ncbi:MAG: hypothetical protein M3128_05735 [Verrucomicrobiota bacterium]|nr:hypothetical protein [Verrucomicrobiota bacterium]
MATKKKTSGKPQIKTRDLKPKKDAKGGFTMVERAGGNLPAVQFKADSFSTYKKAE